MHFKNSKTSINFALFEYHCLHLAICLTVENSHDEYPVNKNPLNEQNHFKWEDASNNRSLISNGAQHDHYLAHMGQ